MKEGVLQSHVYQFRGAGDGFLDLCHAECLLVRDLQKVRRHRAVVGAELELKGDGRGYGLVNLAAHRMRQRAHAASEAWGQHPGEEYASKLRVVSWERGGA